MNPLLTHELIWVEHASRVASGSAHQCRIALVKTLRRRRDQEPITSMEEVAPAIEIIGQPISDQTQSIVASEVSSMVEPECTASESRVR